MWFKVFQGQVSSCRQPDLVVRITSFRRPSRDVLRAVRSEYVAHLIDKPDNNQGSGKVAKEGENPVAGQLEEVAAPLIQGSWHVGRI